MPSDSIQSSRLQPIRVVKVLVLLLLDLVVRFLEHGATPARRLLPPPADQLPVGVSLVSASTTASAATNWAAPGSAA